MAAFAALSKILALQPLKNSCKEGVHSITFCWRQPVWLILVRFLKYSDTRHQMDLSGVGPIASMFWMNEEFAIGLGKDICLDGVVCVVDAVFGENVRAPLL